MKRKLFLVTGNGFIGLNLAESLSDKNFKIFLFGKNKKTKIRKKINLFNINIFNLKKLDYFNFYDSYVILSVLNSKDKNFKKNFENLLKFFNQKKIKKIIFLSSVSVYGNSNPKVSLLNDYAKKCFFSEKIVQKYFKNYLILRISNLFGKYRTKLGTIEKLIMTYRNIKTFAFLKKNVVRSYLSIEEFSQIIEKILRLESLKGIYDVSNKNYIFTMEDLIKKFENFYKNEIILNRNIVNVEINRSIIKSSKLLKLINHKSKTNFELELKKIDRFYKK